MTETEKALQRQIYRLDEEKDLLKKRIEKLRRMYIEQVSLNEELSEYIHEMEELREYEIGKAVGDYKALRRY